MQAWKSCPGSYLEFSLEVHAVKKSSIQKKLSSKMLPIILDEFYVQLTNQALWKEATSKHIFTINFTFKKIQALAWESNQMPQYILAGRASPLTTRLPSHLSNITEIHYEKQYLELTLKVSHLHIFKF